MSQNRITGDIPPQIGNIWGLTELRFDDNELTANFSNGNGAAAIGNAIYNACGARVLSFPMTPDRVLEVRPE